MESIYENGGIIGATLAFDDPDFYQIETTIPRGEAQFTTPATTSWTAPTGVTSVSVVCVGGGGGGNSQNGAGGHGGAGGGLGWKNNIPVTPGVSYTVIVGRGGARNTLGAASNGGQSYFIDTSTVAGFGGQGGVNDSGATGGSYVGDGGGNGGNVPTHISTVDATGGGGAGGYSGNGGAAGAINNAGNAGSGGGGGGGGAGGSADAGGAGGGVGIFGEGSNGTAGTYGGGNGRPGGGGSGGAAGSASPGSTARPSTGGLYGGGGGGAEISNENGPGAGGAVRIIWGGERAFPSINTANGQGTTTGLINANQKNSGIWNLKAVYNTFVGVTSLSFVASANADNTSITIPATAEVGDLCLLFDLPAVNNVPTPETTPTGVTGWTNLTSYQSSVFIPTTTTGHVGIYVWGKALQSGDPGSTVSGSAVGGATGTRRKIILVFRPDATISNFSSFDIESEATSGDPAAQTITASAESAPVISFAVYRSFASIATASFSPTASGSADSGTTARVSYRIENTSPSDVTADIADSGTVTVLQTFYVKIT